MIGLNIRPVCINLLAGCRWCQFRKN
jgi:hypothetical protein